VLCFSLLCLYSHASVHQDSNASADKLALLSFKSMLSSPSQGLLASWNASNHFCRWTGVYCGHRHPERVVSLHVNSFDISGHISPSLGNLTFLRELDLGDNQLFGEVPMELCRLVRLQVLNLSNNQLQGQIPLEIGLYMDLLYLNLGYNSLSGEIPLSLAHLPLLEYLALNVNKLSGVIPSGLGNVTSLRVLRLDHNTLSGGIPSSLGMLPRLSRLAIGFNTLSGPILDSFWNISTLTMYSVQTNMLNGSIPPSAFSNLRNLQEMYIDHNSFHGPIPRPIANFSDLSLVQVSHNLFSGIVPPEIGRLSKLRRLRIGETLIEAKEPKDWEFLVALTNCSHLQDLELGHNKFGGVLPNSVSNLSTSLTVLVIGDSNISGSFPSDIGNLINLQILEFSNNSFTGSLPSSLGTLKNLSFLHVSDNYMSGSVPLTIGNLTELNYLGLSGNSFSGRIPGTLGNLRKLGFLYLSSNNFVGTVPKELFNVTSFSQALYLDSNNLEGSIPQEIGNLKGLVEFFAGWNKLSGEIPITLGECQLLQSLYLQNNMLSGSIPALQGQLLNLESLDLSSNNLSGQIPKFLENLTMLYYLNLSFNSFVGQVPSFGIFANASAISIQGNDKLCGGIPDIHLPPCSFQLPKKKHVLLMIPIILTTAATLFILALLYFLRTKCKKGRTEIPSTMSMHGHPLVSYAQLAVATDDFSTINLLGSGSFGTVYKGNLHGESGESSNVVAVKVLKLQSPGSIKTFRAECEALRHVRHRNIVKIVTACLSIDNNGNDFKAFVYEFMPNGSLECWLHPATTSQTEQRSLNLLERVSILLDVAFALDYLHCHGPAPVVHCDLKPSNVLLDADMVAHVGDFGLAKIIVDTSPAIQQSISSMGFRGTIGYAPPG
jgi:receptor kinase-like protein